MKNKIKYTLFCSAAAFPKSKDWDIQKIYEKVCKRKPLGKLTLIHTVYVAPKFIYLLDDVGTMHTVLVEEHYEL